jgi:cytochrome c oxidase cbb3-type subunit 3
MSVLTTPTPPSVGPSSGPTARPPQHARHEAGAEAFPADPLTGHEYDGIREYDNPTPGWWHLIFIATVVFSFFYVLFWHFSPVAWTIQDTWQEARDATELKTFGAMGDLKPDQETILGLAKDEKLMGIARSMFKGTCAQCHAQDGGGLPGSGVNLTDDSYKNVAKVEDIFRVITEGANSGAMPSHRAKFSDKQRVLLSAYVASLRGTRPANPKAPEGQAIPAWPEVAPKPAATTPATPAGAEPGAGK